MIVERRGRYLWFSTHFKLLLFFQHGKMPEIRISKMNGCAGGPRKSSEHALMIGTPDIRYPVHLTVPVTCTLIHQQITHLLFTALPNPPTTDNSVYLLFTNRWEVVLCYIFSIKALETCPSTINIYCNGAKRIL